MARDLYGFLLVAVKMANNSKRFKGGYIMQKVNFDSKLIILLIALVSVTGCTTNSGMKKAILKGSAIGAAIGGAGGGIHGAGDQRQDTDDVVVGAGIGAVLGGVVGAITYKVREGIDTDGDGVPDKLDLCPGTPESVQVDSKGCPLDGDGDGVYDDRDKCPDTPEGVRVDDTGCPQDADRDGVYDYLDKCPETPEGIKVDKSGCPPDTDLDGVPDYLDRCPDTPKGAQVDEKGCSVVGEKLFILKGINFEFDSSRISKESEAKLDVAVKTLKENPSIQIKIVGHTCSLGTEKYNMGLSLRRAKAVKNYLVSKGIDAERLSIEGKGENRPIASNDTEEGRKENRRIEFVILSK